MIKTEVAVEAPPGSIKDGIDDIKAGLKRWPVWWMLTWQSIKSQYRRTYLGPWWLTIQMVIFVAGLSLLFGILLQQDLKIFVPYVTLGFVGFNYMTGMIQGGAASITSNGALIKSTPGPLSIYALRIFATNTIQFLHDAVVVVLVLVILQVHVSPALVLLPVSLAVLAINGIAVGLWLGPVVARYRDVGQIVNALMRVLFFFTPIFWVPTDLSNAQLVALSGWNPLAYLLQFFRSPLLGDWPSTVIVLGTAIITVVNVLIALVHFSRTRDRLAYWL